MASLRPKFYFLAPTTDSPVNGPIFLGGIITHPRNADCPLNNSPLLIDPAVIPVQTVENKDYSVTYEKTRSFTVGIWASFLANILGISGEISGDLGNKASETWSIKTLKTMSFTPTPDYIRQSLENSSVKEFIAKDANWLRSSRVYMITGLKFAYGASGVVTWAKMKGLNLHAGFDATSFGVPVTAGPLVGATREDRVEHTFGEKTPFVLAFRMQRIKVSSSGNIQDGTVAGGMLGLDDANEVWTPPGQEQFDFVVHGLEADADADEFEIDDKWEVLDVSSSLPELCGCSLAQG
ncbi:hypothetical protein K504DRAFT_445058 [Pleomassaria siparia CBS 279.74]|uniref:Uncharacterized protein n=1 Tax=Pleomassaria siparia CBS 279.74 TaxID=1314801 RepID=A0A6G1JQ87_9PLEO|nr:hypothetical protein K504DRAFT_445058 [Pleomassaria siparia CBS 279.74]